MEAVWNEHGQLAMNLSGEILAKDTVMNEWCTLETWKGWRVIHDTGHGGRQKLKGMKKPEAFLYLGEPYPDKVIWAHEFVALLKRIAKNGDPIAVFLDTCHSRGMVKPQRAKDRTDESGIPCKFTEALGPCVGDMAADDYATDANLPANIVIFTACGAKEFALGNWYSYLDSPTGHGYSSSTMGLSLATYSWVQTMGRGATRVGPFHRDAEFLSRHTLIASSWQGGILPNEVPNMRCVDRLKDNHISVITGKWTI